MSNMYYGILQYQLLLLMHYGFPGSSYDLGGHKHELSTPSSLNENSGHSTQLSIVPIH